MKREVFNFKMNWGSFWVLSIAFVLSVIFAFIRIAAENTIGRISLQGYEVGQTAVEDIFSPINLEALDDSSVRIEKGDFIVKKGYPITPEQYDTLKKIADSPASTDFVSLGKSVLFLLLLIILFYFVFSRPVLNRDVKLQEIIFCAVCFVVVYALCSLCIGLGNFNPTSTLLLVMPTSLVVLLSSLVYGNSTGLVIGVLMALGVWESCGFNNILLGYVLGSSLMSARLVKNVRTRNGLVSVSLVLTLFDMVFIVLLGLVFGFGTKVTSGSDNAFFGFVGKLRSILSVPLFVGINGFLSGMLCLGLLTPLELMLNTTSPFRLKDLADMDNEIFHEMQKKAVGTYNHSLSVASMARAACDAIGANSQLAYVGAIYHDIGKLENPEYFTENQNGVNPHDSLDPIVSAGYLENHVSHGVDKAKELGLPQAVVDIIAEHHGNSVKAFFMKNELDLNEKLPLDQQRTKEEIEAEYRYKAHRSSSRESAVVHLADSIEAASVSKKNELQTSEDRQRMIEFIISKKVEDHQLDDSGISYGDLEKIKAAFLKELNDKNYTRIKYQQESPKQEGALDNEKADGEKALDGDLKSKTAAGEAVEQKRSTKIQKALKDDAGGEESKERKRVSKRPAKEKKTAEKAVKIKESMAKTAKVKVN